MPLTKIFLIETGEKNNGCEQSSDLVFNALKEIGSSEKGKLINFNDLNYERLIFDLNLHFLKLSSYPIWFFDLGLSNSCKQARFFG